MEDGLKSLRCTACLMAALGVLMCALALSFDFSVRGESYPFAQAWDRGLVQGFLLVNAALVAIALALLASQAWARWAACLWGCALVANGLIAEWRHYGSVNAASLMEGVPIAALWGWLLFRRLFAPKVSAVFAKRADVWRREPGHAHEKRDVD
jgi:hypothetical protein